MLSPVFLRLFMIRFAYFLRRGHEGWRSLGGVLLCVTGCEALFADLGHFSRKAIQFSFAFLAWPCLILTYLGQVCFSFHTWLLSWTMFRKSIILCPLYSPCASSTAFLFCACPKPHDYSLINKVCMGFWRSMAFLPSVTLFWNRSMCLLVLTLLIWLG